MIHGICIAFIVTGAGCMLSDAFGTKVIWIHRMIIDIMDPGNNFNGYYKDEFLGTMSRIVRLDLANLQLYDLST